MQEAGATVTHIELPPINAEKSLSRDPFGYLGETPLSGNPPAIAALMASDLVLDLMGLLFSPEQLQVLQSGTKILLAMEPPEILVRTIPTLHDRQRVLAATDRLRRAKTMHVTSKAGTSATFELGEYPTFSEYGFVDEPGRWDNWPSGFVFTFANEGRSSGTLVLDKGDILLPQKTYMTDRVVMHVQDGYVRQIEGGVDAEMLLEFMNGFNDPEAFAMSHVGWGLQPRCHWSTLSLYDREQTIGMDARAYEGNFLFSLGPNSEAGGTRTTPCHLDIPLRNCTVAIDGEVVVRDGKVLEAGT
ncbi:Leucyl aminopeptidase (aminopeptidase T) [Variovorax sp. WDL1]|nr:Leucyl aminopeptidase (aminopeptidase T) [Variovorax sp. WDL1]